MRSFVVLALCFFTYGLFGQIFTESDIKKLAGQLNLQLKGVDLGNDIKAKGCFSIGRTLVYQYNVHSYWEAPQNIKEEVISNLITIGAAKTYFLNDIDVEFHYYKGNTIIKKVSIKSKEFSSYYFKLGDYISIKDHPKAKGVNMKIKVPIGWEVKEGNRPNIVKKFTNEENMYLILTKNNVTFFSRNQILEALADDNYKDELIQDYISILTNPLVLEKEIVTIDTYPTLKIKIKGEMERSGISLPLIMTCWTIFYEDKIVFLQAMGMDTPEYKILEQLYFQITNSVIFPEQYY